MPAYMIIRCRIDNREPFMRYAQRAAELVAQFGGEYLVRGGERETLEGDFGDGAFVISKWPSREAALAFWNSDDYRKARRLRAGHARADVTIIEGVA